MNALIINTAKADPFGLDKASKRADGKTLRDKNRALRRQLTEIAEIVRDNDHAVALQHQLALLLLARHPDWQRRAENLLRRGMQAMACQLWICPQPAAQPIAKQIRKLPAGGCALSQPLIRKDKKAKGQPARSAMLVSSDATLISASTLAANLPTSSTQKIYYHLPLRRGSKTVGLLLLTMRADVFCDGDDALCRRLAALLAAAI